MRCDCGSPTYRGDNKLDGGLCESCYVGELEAMVEQCKSVEAENLTLRKRVEELEGERNALARYADRYHSTLIIALQGCLADADRYRTALERIDATSSDPYGHCREGCSDIAREALREW